jgi:hypothetical protein
VNMQFESQRAPPQTVYYQGTLVINSSTLERDSIVCVFIQCVFTVQQTISLLALFLDLCHWQLKDPEKNLKNDRAFDLLVKSSKKF